jgi:hypothetical protein
MRRLMAQLRNMAEALTEELIVEASSKRDALKLITRWRTAAMICFVSGAFLGISALLMSFLTAFYTQVGQKIEGNIECALTLASLLSLIGGAHCLDRIWAIKIRDTGYQTSDMLPDDKTAGARIGDQGL